MSKAEKVWGLAFGVWGMGFGEDVCDLRNISAVDIYCIQAPVSAVARVSAVDMYCTSSCKG